jgi:DNA gyrase/topoisomerase IV subunit A
VHVSPRASVAPRERVDGAQRAGGEILATDGIRQAYHAGRGSITLRGKAFVDDGDRGGRKAAAAKKANGKAPKQAIIITELPYQTNKVGWPGAKAGACAFGV